MIQISILDTTLRDGEQTAGVSFSPEEKLIITQSLIEKGHVPRVEVCSCKTSRDEQDALMMIMNWAQDNGHDHKIEVLSFVDGRQSLDWIADTGCHHINLLAKGSRSHCEKQLGKSVAEHSEDIKKTIDIAHSRNVNVSVYLEDWSRGVQADEDYVLTLINALSDMEIGSIHLCDTLGILDPVTTQHYVRQTLQAFPTQNFEFHAHNDYGLATANSLTAAREGVSGLHCTLNGLGERAGNASLFEVVVGLKDFDIAETGIEEKALCDLSQLGVSYSQKQIGENAPIVGKNVFTHVAGIHADGMSKGNLYVSLLNPDRFGREWRFPVSKLSGKSTLKHYLNSSDSIDLSVEEQAKLLKRIQSMIETNKDFELTPTTLHDVIKEIKK